MDLNIEENTLKHRNINVPTEYNVSEEENKIFQRNRILSTNIFKVNYSWVSNLGEGKLWYWDFLCVNFQFLYSNNWKIKTIDYLY